MPRAMNRAPDPSFAYRYSDLTTLPPTSTDCLTQWRSGCRVTIHYEQHIHQAQAVTPGEPYRHPEPGERHDDDRERHRYPDCARDRARRAADIREWLRTFTNDRGGQIRIGKGQAPTSPRSTCC